MDYDKEYEYSNIKLWALRVENNEPITAPQATKYDGPFYCPDSLEELIIRKCSDKRDHFAYKARLSPVATKESELHNDCKNELLEVLRNSYPDGKWEKERDKFPADKDKGYQKVRPDLSGRINKDGVIIEIQASNISIEKILHRTEQYSKRGAYILWIIPLEEDLGSDNFRPRLFERFLHTMYYGRVYYWCRGNSGNLTPVHYGKAERYIEESSWYDADGTEIVVGGYYKTYLRVKKPEYGSTLNLISDFKIENRDSFKVENEKLSVPNCKIFMDKKFRWWEKEEMIPAN